MPVDFSTVPAAEVKGRAPSEMDEYDEFLKGLTKDEAGVVPIDLSFRSTSLKIRASAKRVGRKVAKMEQRGTDARFTLA